MAGTKREYKNFLSTDTMTKSTLQLIAKDIGVSTSGSKEEITQRINAYTTFTKSMKGMTISKETSRSKISKDTTDTIDKKPKKITTKKI